MIYLLTIRSKDLETVLYRGEFQSVQDMMKCGDSILAQNGLISPCDKSWYNIANEGSIRMTPYIRVVKKVPNTGITINPSLSNISSLTLEGPSFNDKFENDPIEDLIRDYYQFNRSIRRFNSAIIPPLSLDNMKEFSEYFLKLGDPTKSLYNPPENTPRIYAQYLKETYCKFIDDKNLKADNPIMYIKKTIFYESYFKWCRYKNIRPVQDHNKWFDKIYDVYAKDPDSYVVCQLVYDD